jgi:RHS repeat-associated protein
MLLYYPYGMLMPDRQYSVKNYSLGFNGQESDSEVKGDGNSYSFTFRVYDSRTGRFLSVDPITKDYPWNSPYAFAENDVVSSIDLEGLEKFRITARSFIPPPTAPSPWYSTNLKSANFKGDNRGSYELNATSYRTEQKVIADFDNKQVYYTNNTAAASVGLDKNGKEIERSSESLAGAIYNTPITEKSSSVTVFLSVDANNKLVTGSPAINYDFAITIAPKKDGTFDYKLAAESDGYPAYELWVTDETNNKSYLLFNRTPTETGETPRALFARMEYKYNLKGNSSKEIPSEKIDFKNKKNSPKEK